MSYYLATEDGFIADFGHRPRSRHLSHLGGGQGC